MDYSDPTDLSSLEQGIEAKKETESTKVLRSTDPKIIGLAGIATLILVYLYYTNQIDVKLGALMLVMVVAIVFIMGQSRTVPKPYLTYEECCYYLDKHLRYMQTRPWGEYAQINPLSKFYLTPITRERWIDKTPWKRPMGVVIQSPEGLEEHYMAEINITNGDLTSFVRTFEAWDGRDMDDVRTTHRPSDAIMMERRAAQWIKTPTTNKQY